MICISGGNSFVGKAIAKILDGKHIVYHVIPKAEIYGGLEDYLTLKGCEVFIHCAWSMDYENDLNDQANDLLNKTVFDSTKKINKFIFISSIHALTNDNAYSQAKKTWETLFLARAVASNSVMSTIFLPHLVAPEVGQNKNSVIYKFYDNWKVGLAMDIHLDQNVYYTDLERFKSAFLSVLKSKYAMRVTPQFLVATVSELKSNFLGGIHFCPTIEALKISNI